MVVVYLLVAMLGAAATLFTIQNPEPASVAFLYWRSAKLPLSLLMLVSALAGVLLAALSSATQQIQLHRRIRYLEGRFAGVTEVPNPPPARVEAAPERMDSPLQWF